MGYSTIIRDVKEEQLDRFPSVRQLITIHIHVFLSVRLLAAVGVITAAKEEVRTGCIKREDGTHLLGRC